MDNNTFLDVQVVHVVPEEQAINYKWEHNANKLDSGLKIASCNDLRELARKGNIELPSYIKEGSVLVKHPFLDNKLMTVEAAENEIIQDKVRCLFRIAKLLGAKSAHSHIENVEEEKMELDVNGKVAYKAVESNLDVKKTDEKKFSSICERTETFQGEFTDANYNKAIEEAKRYNLWNGDVKYLIEQRNPQESNSMQSQRISTEVASELNKLLECAFSLNVLKGVFSLGTSVSSSISKKYKLIVATDITF